MSSSPFVFDRRLHRLHRDRAAGRFESFSFLKDNAADDLAESLEAVTRSFDLALDLGAHGGQTRAAIMARPTLASRIGHWISSDLSPAFASRLGTGAVVASEQQLPFAPQSFDLVTSTLALHWVNDLPGALIQIRMVLRPDGFFIGQLLGGATLNDLRSCLIDAETEIRGGAAMRVSPFADVQDMAGLMQRAGFALPVADTQTLTVRYSNPFRLFEDLRGMGETSAPADSNAPPLTRAILMRAMSLYQQRHSDPDGRMRATFEILTVSGWAPAPDQPKPLRPGSAKSRLSDALGVPEHKAGDKAG